MRCSRIYPFVLMFSLIAKLPVCAVASTPHTPNSTGSLMSKYIHYQFAVYYLPTPKTDPIKGLRKHLQARYPQFTLVKEFPENPNGLLIQAALESDVPRHYAPPDMNAMRYFAHGLSKEQAEAIQHSRQVLILNFAYPKRDVWQGLHAATELVEDLARENQGLVWDEITREIFTPEVWHIQRLQGWRGGVPTVYKQITIHAYQDKDYVRAITLGMEKFGLPDVVVQNFSWSDNRSMGNLINLLCQALLENPVISKSGNYELNIRAIKDPTLREAQLKSLEENATGIARLSLRKGTWQEGDPANRLLEIGFDRYPGEDEHARQNALLTSLFGAQDSIAKVKHNAALLAASERAKAKLPSLRDAFQAGLQPGEFILVKIPFNRPDGGHEYMWVEVTKWNGNNIYGLLKMNRTTSRTCMEVKMCTSSKRTSSIIFAVIRMARRRVMRRAN